VVSASFFFVDGRIHGGSGAAGGASTMAGSVGTADKVVVVVAAGVDSLASRTGEE
jgi:hypothetical protein